MPECPCCHHDMVMADRPTTDMEEIEPQLDMDLLMQSNVPSDTKFGCVGYDCDWHECMNYYSPPVYYGFCIRTREQAIVILNQMKHTLYAPEKEQTNGEN